MLSIDIETASPRDLAKCGVYAYAEDFTLLLFSYSLDGGAIQCIDIAHGEEIDGAILDMLVDENVIKSAFNVGFERICLSAYLRQYYPERMHGQQFLSPRGWHCSMVWSASLGLPRTLAEVAEQLHLDCQKMAEGKELIRKFSTEGRESVEEPLLASDDWELFKKYNIRDVEVEMAITRELSPFPLWEEFYLDQEINDRGVCVDRQLVKNAIKADTQNRETMMARMQELTGLDNPNSVVQLKEWLANQGIVVASLDKKTVGQLLENELSADVREVLELRLNSAKSSVKKYQAIEGAMCADGRVRGMFRFYGASRSGRFSSKIINLQNLPRNGDNLEDAREALKRGEPTDPDTLSQLLRTALIPASGKFIVADFSSIEARVVAWLAGEEWVLEAFRNGRDIYCATASRMYGVPVEKGNPLRQKGKTATLACSYGGSVGALKAFISDNDSELKAIVDAWRGANPHIVALWQKLEDAVFAAIRHPNRGYCAGRLTARYDGEVAPLCGEVASASEAEGERAARSGETLFITLPSGRALAYRHPRIEEGKWGYDALTYEGYDVAHKWGRVESFGGKLVENCLARDTLVLTDKGLMPIAEITQEEKIWDGVEWVSHGGVINQGVQETIQVDGLRMTPEHKILTEKGWVACAKSAGFKWAKVRLPDGFGAGWKDTPRKQEVAMPVHLWEKSRLCGGRLNKKITPQQVVRMHERRTDKEGFDEARDESAPRLWRLARDEATMRGSTSPCVPQLWRSRNYCVQGVERELRGFLARYVTDVSERIGVRQNRQQQRLLPRKLSLGNAKGKREQQKEHVYNRHPLRQNANHGTGTAHGYQSRDVAISCQPSLAHGITLHPTRRAQQVYDIRNCGPRHQFVVYDGEPPQVSPLEGTRTTSDEPLPTFGDNNFDANSGNYHIVSNCTQAIARDILMHAMENLRDYGIVAHVHDEIILETNARVDEVIETMTRVPDWAEGLPLSATGFETAFYRKE